MMLLMAGTPRSGAFGNAAIRQAGIGSPTSDQTMAPMEATATVAICRRLTRGLVSESAAESGAGSNCG